MNGETEHSNMVSTYMNEPKIIVKLIVIGKLLWLVVVAIFFFFDVWRQQESLVCLLTHKNIIMNNINRAI